MNARIIIALLLLLMILCGCSVIEGANHPSNIVSPLPEPGVSDSDMIAIYTAVLQDLIGQGSQWPKVYVIAQTDDRIASPGNNITSVSIELSSSVQTQISANLSGLSTEIVWVSSFQQVQLDKSTGTVIGGGAIVTLGNIKLVNAGQVQVAGGIYYANLGAGGGTYVVEKQAGQWKVTGMTGSHWIS